MAGWVRIADPGAWYGGLWVRLHQATVAASWPELNWTRTVFGQPYTDLLAIDPGTDLAAFTDLPPGWVIDNDDEGPFALPAGTYWLITYDSSPTMPTADPVDGFDDFTDDLGNPAAPFSAVTEIRVDGWTPTAAFTVTAELDTAGTPLVAVVAAPDDFELIDQELESYPVPVLDEFGRPVP